MKTHYVRRARPARDAHLDTPQEAHVLGAIPGDQLVTEDRVVELTAAFCRKNTEAILTPKAVGNLLRTLVSKGFVVEIHGSRLERILKDCAAN
jgi:hypothetical protein